MRVVILLLAGLIAISADPIPSGQGERIVGGWAATITQYPFVVALERSTAANIYQFYCGGSILNYRTVLTVASCVAGSTPVQWRFRIGTAVATTGGTLHNVASFIINPGFNPNTLNSDIALVRPTTNIILTGVAQAGFIPGPNYNLAANQPVWAVGWGSTFYGGPLSTQLQQVQVWTVTQSVCRLRYAELGIGWNINDNMLCAGWLDVGGRGQCVGDYGSPLLHNNVIVGIYSFGLQCALARHPAVNTRISTYSNWIQANA